MLKFGRATIILGNILEFDSIKLRGGKAYSLLNLFIVGQ
jgi:hypothetical protein